MRPSNLPATGRVLLIGGLLLVTAACGQTATTTTGTGGPNPTGTGTSTNATSGPTTSTSTGTTGGTVTPSGTATTCVPLSTIPPRPGEPAQPTPTPACGPVMPPSAPVTTTPGGGPVTTFPPDPTRGVIQGQLLEQVMCVRAPCPPQPIAGQVVIRSDANPNEGRVPAVVTREVGADGQFSALLEPGTYSVRAESPHAKNCPTLTVTVTEGQTGSADVVCTVG